MATTPEQRRSNVRLALILATIAAVFAAGFVAKIVLLGAACLGFRMMRTTQMVTQYRWLYERTGPLTWRARLG